MTCVGERLSYVADMYRSTLPVGGPRSYEFPLSCQQARPQHSRSTGRQQNANLSHSNPQVSDDGI